MFSRNEMMTALVILSIVLSTTNALAITNESNISDVQESNYTIKDDTVILHSLVGDIPIPIPEDIKTELNKRRIDNSRNEEKRFERLSYFGSSNIDGDIRHSNAFADFFECNEQAQVALSVHSENYRVWEAFFKRNTIGDTIAVRYCCNLLEYVDNAHMQLSPECRDRVRLQDHVMTNSEVRFKCRQYEFHSAECFLVRWMYWWIPIVALTLIMLGICLVCCCMKSRRSRSYLKAKEEEKRFRSSLMAKHENGV